MLILSSCSDFAFKKEKYYVEKENLQWLSKDSSFTMIDSSGIRQNFVTYGTVYNNETPYSATMFLGICINKSTGEEYFQSFTSNYQLQYTCSIEAFYDHGDELNISIGDLTVSYLLRFNKINYLSYNNNSICSTQNDDGTFDDSSFKSKMEFLDTMTIGDKLYSNVLHFKLNDFRSEWTDFTIREFYAAANYGLIEYIYENGVKVVRE